MWKKVKYFFISEGERTRLKVDGPAKLKKKF
jgi:hypothetical protein